MDKNKCSKIQVLIKTRFSPPLCLNSVLHAKCSKRPAIVVCSNWKRAKYINAGLHCFTILNIWNVFKSAVINLVRRCGWPCCYYRIYYKLVAGQSCSNRVDLDVVHTENSHSVKIWHAILEQYSFIFWWCNDVVVSSIIKLTTNIISKYTVCYLTVIQCLENISPITLSFLGVLGLGLLTVFLLRTIFKGWGTLWIIFSPRI